MNISWDMTSGLLRRMGSAGMLKSTRDRLERQEETQKQVDYFEQKKDNLKNVKCGSVEEIAEKLNMFHSYEDQIAAAKAAYNSEQMWHILDESTERGEKIAEAAEKSKPKTPEERQEEMVEEALGIEESGGMLEEILDEVGELTEELTDEITGELIEETTEELAGESRDVIEEITEEMTKELTGDAVEEITEELAGELTGDAVEAVAASTESMEALKVQAALNEKTAGVQEDALEMLKKGYVPFDVRL